jgi:hypothetical protein
LLFAWEPHDRPGQAAHRRAGPRGRGSDRPNIAQEKLTRITYWLSVSPPRTGNPPSGFGLRPQASEPASLAPSPTRLPREKGATLFGRQLQRLRRRTGEAPLVFGFCIQSIWRVPWNDFESNVVASGSCQDACAGSGSYPWRLYSGLKDSYYTIPWYSIIR